MGRRILIADDDASIREFLSELLLSHGYEVDVAENGEVALNLCNAIDYDLVVTDWMMPKLTGVELAERLQARNPSPRVILMTGSHLTKGIGVLKHVKIYTVLLKPMRMSQIMEAIQQVLSSAGMVERSSDNTPIKEYFDFQS